MNKWVNAIETALEEFHSENNVPYDFERFAREAKELPDRYIVYFLVSSSPISSADGKERLCVPRIQCSFFYRKKADFLTIPDKLIKKLTDKGFLRSSTGRIPYNQSTGHYGWRCDFNYLERR